MANIVVSGHLVGIDSLLGYISCGYDLPSDPIVKMIESIYSPRTSLHFYQLDTQSSGRVEHSSLARKYT
jgi:hypothetical protein